MIDTLHLKNFTTFHDLKVEFSPKINVIIGENGTGKSHLLKAVYSQYPYKQIDESSVEEYSKLYSKRFKHLFKPIEGKVWKLKTHGADAEAPAEIITEISREGRKESRHYQFNTNSQEAKLSFSLPFENTSFVEENLPRASFIPPKEILSFMEGMLGLSQRLNLSFDQTYLDLFSSFDSPTLIQDQLTEKSQAALRRMEEVCKGKFIFHGGGKVTFNTAKSQELSVNATAEGFRKLGMLYRLIEIGDVQPGQSGPLIWDEPEANLNPKLLGILTSILHGLASEGQQIILSTHNYVFLKRLDLLDQEHGSDLVTYHSLSRNEETGKIEVHSTESYAEIKNNPIDEVFDDLTISQARLLLGS